MKKSYKKLLGSLILVPLHKFKYKTFTIDNGVATHYDWVDAWTEGKNIYFKDGWVPLASMRHVTAQTLKAMVNAHLRAKMPGHEYYTYAWEYASDKVILNREHPWLKEMENDV